MKKKELYFGDKVKLKNPNKYGFSDQTEFFVGSVYHTGTIEIIARVNNLETALKLRGQEKDEIIY